jgi:hypothetical protein
VRADLLDQREERLGAAEAAHPAQHGLAGVLEGHVEVVGHALGAGDGGQQGRPRLRRLQVGHADAVDPRQLGQARQQPLQRGRAAVLAAEVLAVGRGVLADQEQLPDALTGEPGRLGQDLLRWSRHERPAERRDGAERAPPVAAGGDLQRGHGRVVEAAAQHARAPAVARHRDVRRGGRPLDRGDGQQRAPVDRRVGLERAAGDHVVQARTEVRVVVEAEHGGRLGQVLGQLGAVTLGHAADGHHLGARLRRLQQRVDRILLGRLDEPAGVHDDDVGALGPVRHLPPTGGEATGELLGVDLVSGAPEGEQGGTARG